MKNCKRIIIVLLITSFLLPLIAACGYHSRVEEPEYPNYYSYRDIPDVTDEEIAAIEKMKTQNQTYTIAMNYSTEAFLYEDGTVGGYTSLFAQWLGTLFGLKFEPKIMEWEALVAGLDNQSVDFSGELTPTPERQEKYFMTQAIAERSVHKFCLNEAQSNTELAATRTLNYGFLQGATTADYLKKEETRSYTETFVRDYDEAAALLKEGKIDAFFADGTSEAAFGAYPEIIVQDYFPLIYTPVSFATANPEYKAVISVLQKYLDNGATTHLSVLYNEGDREYRRYKFNNLLTAEEKAYIAEHNVDNPVPYGSEYDNYPINFYNETEKQWQGIAVDVLKEISELSGMAFMPANEPGDAWPEILTSLENGELPMTTELIKSHEREGRFLWADAPYTVDNYALISRLDSETISVNQVLYSKVAIAKDTAYEEVFNKWFPNHQYKFLYDSTDECFRAVERGEADFTFASTNLLLSMTNYHEQPGFKLNLLFDASYESGFGFYHEEKVLSSIISKAQKQIDLRRIEDQWTHRVFDYRTKLAETQIPYLIGVAILLGTLLLLLWIMFQRNKRSGKILEEQVQQRTAQLEIQTQAAQEASKAKGEFLSRMSHEIRTPLNAIIGMAQIAKQTPNLDPELEKSNDEIMKASYHLLEIINDILDMSKIESGKFTLVEEPFSLKAAMDEIAMLMELRCEEKCIDFSTNIDQLPDTNVLGDKLRLKQVLINLLGNSVKFTDEGGVIKFHADLAAETEDTIVYDFVVEDNGIGMSEEQVKNLFQAFEQTDDKVAIKYGGTGLGLAISQNLVQKMGGEINVESKKDVGSKFFFQLIFIKTRKKVEEKRSSGIPNLHAKRILVAEDIAINRMILKELLKESGVQIEEAEDGLKAVEAIAAAEPDYYDLVFMDIQMPNMDGYEATRTIRSLNKLGAKNIPIIAMTANAYKEDIEKALDSGMNGHIAKPLDINIVYDTLRRYIT